MREKNDDHSQASEEQNLKDFRHDRRGGYCRKEHRREAQTFRRGRALEFLIRMNVQRDTLKQQLETPELQSIHPILVGDLKAVE